MIRLGLLQLIYLFMFFFFWERMLQDLQIKESLQPLPLIAKVIKQKRTNLLNDI